MLQKSSQKIIVRQKDNHRLQRILSIISRTVLTLKTLSNLQVRIPKTTTLSPESP